MFRTRQTNSPPAEPATNAPAEHSSANLPSQPDQNNVAAERPRPQFRRPKMTLGKGNIISAALAYAERGWQVLPLTSGAKTPMTSRGLHDATDDPDAICSWFDTVKRPNLGIRTGRASGIVVLDVDVKDDAGGLESLAELEAEHGELVTRRAFTPSGGLHLYFRNPDVMVRNKVRFLPGLDVRGEGGYIVAPPSSIKMIQYEWEDETVEIAEMPGWLVEKLAEGARAGGRAADGHALLTMAEALGGVGQGLRNDTVFRLACRMRQDGYDYGQAVQVVLAVAAHCNPPLPEDEAIRCANNAFGYAPPTYLSELGNAERFLLRNAGNVRYVTEDGTWMVWDGMRWETNAVEAIHRLVKDTVRGIADEADDVSDEILQKAILSHARSSESKAKIDAMLALASREPGVPIRRDQLDADDLLFAVKNGVVDLRNGEFRPGCAEDLITRSSDISFDADARCPHWETFLGTIFAGDVEIIEYLQRVVGYILTGLATERVFFVFFGDGANGKTTFLEVLRALLGTYGLQSLSETFMASKWNRGVRNDIARLAGARFVSASESEEGERLAEGLVKNLTGGDTVTARFLFQEYTEFRSKFKLVLATNHRPEIRGNDPAIWDRLHLVHFPVSIPAEQRDKNLRTRLLGELPGILNWAITGCTDWQLRGLQPPDSVLAATTAYREELDLLDRWLSERIVRAPGARTSATDLYVDFRRWMELQGEEPISHRLFGERMMAKGVQRIKSNIYFYKGVQLRSGSGSDDVATA